MSVLQCVTIIFYPAFFYNFIIIQWLKDTFLKYLEEWEREVMSLTSIDNKEKSRMLLSRETREGLKITGIVMILTVSAKRMSAHAHTTVHSFCELGPKLLSSYGFKYLLSEVFSQDPLEAYFSRQRHKGGACDNPSAQQFFFNTVSLVQQGEVYRDLKTMNVKSTTNSIDFSSCDKPLPKRCSIRNPQ